MIQMLSEAWRYLVVATVIKMWLFPKTILDYLNNLILQIVVFTFRYPILHMKLCAYLVYIYMVLLY